MLVGIDGSLVAFPPSLSNQLCRVFSWSGLRLDSDYLGPRWAHPRIHSRIVLAVGILIPIEGRTSQSQSRDTGEHTILESGHLWADAVGLRRIWYDLGK